MVSFHLLWLLLLLNELLRSLLLIYAVILLLIVHPVDRPFSSIKNHGDAFLLAEALGLGDVPLSENVGYHTGDRNANIHDDFAHLAVRDLWEPGGCHVVEAPTCQHAEGKSHAFEVLREDLRADCPGLSGESNSTEEHEHTHAQD